MILVSYRWASLVPVSHLYDPLKTAFTHQRQESTITAFSRWSVKQKTEATKLWSHILKITVLKSSTETLEAHLTKISRFRTFTLQVENRKACFIRKELKRNWQSRNSDLCTAQRAKIIMIQVKKEPIFKILVLKMMMTTILVETILFLSKTLIEKWRLLAHITKMESSSMIHLKMNPKMLWYVKRILDWCQLLRILTRDLWPS